MKRTLRATVSTLAATTALLLGTALASPAQAVPDDGKGELVLSILDSSGKPLAASLSIISTTGVGEGGIAGGAATLYEGSLSTGRYGFMAMAPWGGFFCAGISTCDITALLGGSPPVVTGVVNITDVETPVSYTLRAPRPAVVAGGNKVGSTLSVALSPAMQNMAALTGALGGGISSGMSVQWLRNGTVIPSGAGPTYETTAADVGKTVAPRLSYSLPWVSQFAGIGMDASPLTLPGVKVGKGGTRTTVEVFRGTIDAGRSTGLRADVTTANLPAAGKVRITIGDWKVTKTLRNGSTRLTVPKNLAPGTYRVVATYLGSSSLSGSKGTDKLTVRRG